MTQTVPHASPDCFLVINCGSSSLKAAVVRAADGSVPLKALAEWLGTPEASLTIEHDGARTKIPLPGAGHREALHEVENHMGSLRPAAIGHRVVHGGEEFTGSVIVDGAVMDAIERCAPLAPLHNPANLTGIRTAMELFPGLPHVAVFDTAFHQTLPPAAFLYAVPRRLYDKFKIRRYGFHGTSHHYVSLEAARRLGKNPAETSLVIMHLGNGCSACAVRDGKSVDCTMGLTPMEGLVMGTRSGDVDPGLHQFLQDRAGMSLTKINSMLNNESGLLGLSGLGNDMRTLAAAAADGNKMASLAIEVFCYRLAKAAAGLTAALGRIDAFVFTGGIGENSAPVRRRAAEHWQVLGIQLDDAANTAHGSGARGVISNTDSRIACLVVPTNEELMIARETARLTA